MPKAQETILEIDLTALKHNFEFLKSKINETTKFLAVVKAFAYGNDADEAFLYMQELGVDYFAVAYTSEGIALRDAGITKPILVLHPLPVSFKLLIERCLEPSIYNHNILDKFIEVASKANQSNYPIHLKFNTGLNRLGFAKNMESIHKKVSESDSVKVKSIFSHMAASEDLEEKEFTSKQISTFKNVIAQFEKHFGYTVLIHMCNTSGILNFPEAHFDMVRSGIGLYGFGNSDKEDENFKPIASLKSVISQIHQIEKGESVGYNRSFKSDDIIKTATIPIGHADGISRIYGNGKGFVIIDGKKAPLVGNVCMDMIMVNVTGIDCSEGDEVIVFDANYSASDLAHNANTISYELITAISQRVKRVIIN